MMHSHSPTVARGRRLSSEQNLEKRRKHLKCCCHSLHSLRSPPLRLTLDSKLATAGATARRSPAASLYGSPA